MKHQSDNTPSLIEYNKALGMLISAVLYGVCAVSNAVALFGAFMVFIGGVYEGSELIGFVLDFPSFDVLSTAPLFGLLALSAYFSQQYLWLFNLVPDHVLRDRTAKPKPLFIVPAFISLTPSAHGCRAPPIPI